METPWPEQVERVAAFLRRARAEARLEQLPGPRASAGAVAKAVGCSVDEVATTVVVLCDERPVLVLVPADRDVDLAKVVRAAGAASARHAPGTEIREGTGFATGSVPPFPRSKEVAHVFVDRRLLVHQTIWVEAGSQWHRLAIPPAELLRLSRGVSVDALSEAAYDEGPGNARRGDATR